jgi:hypothetical protein
MSLSGFPDSTVRAVTLELSALVLRQLILAVDCTSVPARVRDCTEKTRIALANQLVDPAHNDPVFLDMFEDELFRFQACHFIAFSPNTWT